MPHRRRIPSNAAWLGLVSLALLLSGGAGGQEAVEEHPPAPSAPEAEVGAPADEAPEPAAPEAEAPQEGKAAPEAPAAGEVGEPAAPSGAGEEASPPEEEAPAPEPALGGQPELEEEEAGAAPVPAPETWRSLEKLSRLRRNLALRGSRIQSDLGSARVRLKRARDDLARLKKQLKREPRSVAEGDRTEAEAIAIQEAAARAYDEYSTLYGEARQERIRASADLQACQADLASAIAQLTLLGLVEGQPTADPLGKEAQLLVQSLRRQVDNAKALRMAWVQIEGVAWDAFTTASRLGSEIAEALGRAEKSSLWWRSPEWISLQTIADAARDVGAGFRWAVRQFATGIPEWLGAFGRRLGTSAGIVSFLLRLIAGGLSVCVGVYGFRALRAAVEQRLDDEDSPSDQARARRARTEAALGIARGLIIFAVGAVILQLTRMASNWLLFLIAVLGACSGYMLLENVAEIALSPADAGRRLPRIPDDHAIVLYKTLRSFFLLSAVFAPVLAGFRIFSYQRPDVVAAVQALYGLAALIHLLALCVAKGGLKGLIPDTGSFASRAARRAATAAPLVVLVLGAVTVVAHSLGYVNLSACLARTLPTAALVITAAWILHRTYVVQVEERLRAIPETERGRADWHVFGRASRPLLGLVERAAFISLAAGIIMSASGLPARHLRDLSAALARPLFKVKDTEVSTYALISAVLVIVLSVLIGRIVREMLREAAVLRRKYDQGVRYAIASVAYYLIVIGAIFWAVPVAGFNWSILAVFAGVAGIGIGFGLQDIVKNFISGIIILLEQPIKVGDFVDLGDLRGTVTQISIRSTTIRTQDNIYVIVPNADFISGQITNYSHRDLKIRLQLEVGVSYNSDMNKVRQVLEKVAKDHPMTLNDPPPNVRMVAFADSSVNFQLLAWVANPTDMPRTMSELHYAVWDALAENGIEIPFPQRDLHIRSDDTLALRDPELRARRAAPSSDEGALADDGLRQ